MGKTKKKRKTNRNQPYSKGTDVDVEIKGEEVPSMTMEFDMPAGEQPGSQWSFNEENTRGKILQRHKREKKVLRDELTELRAQRLKANKKTADGKALYKELSKQMQEKEKEMNERHSKELQKWDDEHSEKLPYEPLSGIETVLLSEEAKGDSETMEM
eukprot:GCRY01001824.1.p1 GENE.GCRY01001824.1~~GCRY01001824.1.p1  ORF type:complete len:157 (+),score=40.83 GCRY01001824.1:53-523(+)